jgi:tellurite resistance protein TerC
MVAVVQITAWHWAGFVGCVLFFLALDLGVFHRRAHVVKFGEALAWTAVWFGLAMAFSAAIHHWRGHKESLEFVTGYLIELSLSMDNVFVIALIFGYFHVPTEHQHRVLFWGILGALIMRGLMIGAGVALIALMHWVLYLFGAFLIYSGIKMILVETEVDPEKNKMVRWARKFYPVSPHLDGQHFFTHWEGRRALTPLALVLLMVETTDLIFALDSIPAIFAVTNHPFIVFTSNVFAILGLRSLYFVLAGAIGYFRYLKVGLSLVLVVIGIKMLLDPHHPADVGHPAEPDKWFQVEIPISVSLLAVGGIIFISMVLSVTAAHREKRAKAKGKLVDKGEAAAKQDSNRP